ncbi:hypothetical protein F511_28401 [Dorcoceras hygrometricum]|uniref:Dystroglycan-like n=1 Tax=Dorcoceras hygrometricum TaxID=472368 RepID=A0A2Z7B6N1_9LAMI|nr:hypothetical protein F511_28401 [Dorcoceras hygrometricum]
MASSLISNSLHISFDSVLGMDDAGLVAVFESFVATGLKGFLGCPAVYYEDALTEFFENGLVRDGMIVSTIQGISVEISEEVFAAAFELPMEGLTDLSEVPKDLVFDAQSIFSESKKQTIYVKAGSFDAVTHERFLLMTAITYGVKINWSSLVFDILKDMVTPGSRQAKGYAIQICVLLKNVPGLELGESRSFPSSRILTEKTVHRYVVINENVGGEEVADAPRVKKTPVKKVASKKRPATDATAKPVVKNKRTTKSKLSKNRIARPFYLLTTQIKPLYHSQPISRWESSVRDHRGPSAHHSSVIDESYFDKEALILSWAETDSTRVALHRKMYILAKYRELLIRKFLEARKINFVPSEGSSATDLKIMEMLSDLHMFVVEELKVQTMAHGLRWEKTCCSKIFEGLPRDRGAVISRTNTNIRSTCWIRTMIRVDGVWFIEPCGDHWSSVISWRLSQLCTAFVQYSLFSGLSTADISSFVSTIAFERTVFRDVQKAQSSVFAIPSVQSALADSPYVQLLLDQCPHSPSTTADSSMHFVEDDIQLEDDSAPDQYISTSSATAISATIDALRESFSNFAANQSRDSRQTNNSLGEVMNKIDHVKRVFLDSIAEQNETFRDLEATRKEVKDIKAALSKDFDDKLADIRNELLEFRIETQGQLASLSTHLAELIAFLTKGSDDKKGEDSSSRRPQPPPDNQSRPSGGNGGSGNRAEEQSRYSGGKSCSRGDMSGSSKRRFSSSGGRPFRRSFEDWLG